MSGATAQADPLEGTAYRTVRRLASGERTEILLAEHRELGAPCVVKVLRSELAGDPSAVDRIRFEAQVLGRLRHPHVVSVWGAGITQDERPFVVMERLKGRTLREELQSRGEPLPAREAVQYTCQLLSALAVMHELGVAHGQIQPENIFLCREFEQDPEEAPFIKLLDFGCARVVPNAARGAPAALEEVQGDSGDLHSDLHAVGSVLDEMLTGSGFSGSSAHSMPAELDRLVHRALSKDINQRCQSAREFLFGLERIAVELRSARHLSSPAPSSSAVSPVEPKAPTAARVWVLAVFLASAVATLGLALYFGLVRGEEAAPEKERAGQLR